MVAFLTQLLLVTRSWFAWRARLEAENLILRQQLSVPRRKSTRGRWERGTSTGCCSYGRIDCIRRCWTIIMEAPRHLLATTTGPSAQPTLSAFGRRGSAIVRPRLAHS